MISSINSNIQEVGYSKTQAPVAKQLPVDSPSKLPANDAGSTVSISQKALELLAVKSVTSSPILAAAVSNNAQVDDLAMSTYNAQLNRQLLETYSNNASDYENSGTTNKSPLAIAAVSQNKQIEELATTAYSAKQAQQLMEIYQKNVTTISDQQPAALDETA